MPDLSDNPVQPISALITCPICGEEYLAVQDQCPNCTVQLTADQRFDTRNIRRKPTIPPAPYRRQEIFDLQDNVILQIFPSGSCVTLALNAPVVLGRRAKDGSLPSHELLDLTPFSGYDHGISRAHCLLERKDFHLVVTDLGSRNGTYLNNRQLAPHDPQIVAHNDRLILGTLHVLVVFSTAR